MIHGAKLLDVHARMLENVPGLATHPQYKENMRDVNAMGMKVARKGLEKVYPTLPIMREVWLATVALQRVERTKLPNRWEEWEG